MDRTRDQALRTRWTGQPLRRFEDVKLVTGKGQFVDDLRLPETLFMEFALSNHARGLIVSLNTVDAENMPGVVVGTYGFDTTCLGTPFHAVIGYRALSVDYSENGKFGKNGLDLLQHGPILGVKFNW